ncbi:predicted protein [Botrytis cinerea T4]|uniref:Uncharacterized protein n=1 Tax=Botryotinia fuckeliana (strain T4) TaxID=999810 RepID=G2Y128_BOTF4|nr:predicted protein [Botrytis cinerea T4]
MSRRSAAKPAGGSWVGMSNITIFPTYSTVKRIVRCCINRKIPRDWPFNDLLGW